MIDKREIDVLFSNFVVNWVYEELLWKEQYVYALPNRAQTWGARMGRRNTLPVIAMEAYGSMSQRYIIDGTVLSVQITCFNLWSDKSAE